MYPKALFLFTVIYAGLFIFSSCGGDSGGDDFSDYIEIIEVTPAEGLVDGNSYTFYINLEYSLDSVEQAVIRVSFNNQIDYYTRSILVEERIETGSGSNSYEVLAQAKYWDDVTLSGVDEDEDGIDDIEDREFTIKAEIPEVKKEDVKVVVDNGILTVRGERKAEKEQKDKKFHRVERYYGSFTRSFTLPDHVDENEIEAGFKDGMLYLSLPKTEEAKPKAIEVKIK